MLTFCKSRKFDEVRSSEWIHERDELLMLWCVRSFWRQDRLAGETFLRSEQVHLS